MTGGNKISLEFFPPREEAGRLKLAETARRLVEHEPTYVSVTYGAGGSTRSGTADTVRLMQSLGCDTAPHLSCIGSSRAELNEILDGYRDEGIRRIVALRGDLPSGMGRFPGEVHYADELVSLIREHSGDWFHIEVAAYPEVHPQAASASKDLDHFVGKVKAGANAAITQYFFNADAYFNFVDRVQARGVDIPIVAGIMPITNFTQLARFSGMCGAEIPRWLEARLVDFQDDKESLRAFGADFVAAMAQRLLDEGAPGLHFYTLNNADATLAVWGRLTLPEAPKVGVDA